jgi:hypothetical protein
VPYTPISDGSTLTAAHLLSEVYNQVISQVTSGSRPGSPADGQMIYETDTDRLYLRDSTGWVQFGGNGQWTSFTPTLTQSGSVGFSANYSRYYKIGRLVHYDAFLTVSGTGTTNNAVTVSLPVTAANVAGGHGSGYITDASTGLSHPGIVRLSSTSAMALLGSTAATTNVNVGQTGTDFDAAIATGDFVVMAITYESAT